VNCTDGPAKIKRPPFGGRFILLQPPGLNRDAPERSAWRIREYTIRKIIKIAGTRFL